MEIDPYATAGELAAAVRSGRARSRDLVECHLDRIERHAELNAVVTVDATGARAAADAADEAVRAGTRLGPLHGVPITVKDAWAVAGVRSTSGLPELADDVPDRDAVVVARLRAAGAVVVGKTNVPPGITGQETANELFGRTVNPWDRGRTPGGSSGGAAAAVAAGLSGADVGSDSGGSIRQPAHCCGVFGHVPTHGVVPLRGHRPQVDLDAVGKDVDLMVAGPLARSAADLELLLDVLAGPDDDRAAGWRLDLPPSRLGTLAGCRVAAWLDDPACPTDAAVRDAIDRWLAALERAGAVVDRQARPGFGLADAQDVAFRLWTASSSERTPAADVDALAADLAAGRVPPGLPRSRAEAETTRHRDWLLLDNERRRIALAWEEFLTGHDVLVCPVIPIVAPEHDPEPDQVASVDHRLARTILVDGRPRPYLDQLTWNIVVGMAGLPATVLPVADGADALPVGAQVVARRYADRTTIAFAGLAAAAHGGFRRPPVPA